MSAYIHVCMQRNIRIFSMKRISVLGALKKTETVVAFSRPSTDHKSSPTPTLFCCKPFKLNNGRKGAPSHCIYRQRLGWFYCKPRDNCPGLVALPPIICYKRFVLFFLKGRSVLCFTYWVRLFSE